MADGRLLDHDGPHTSWKAVAVPLLALPASSAYAVPCELTDDGNRYSLLDAQSGDPDRAARAVIEATVGVMIEPVGLIGPSSGVSCPGGRCPTGRFRFVFRQASENGERRLSSVFRRHGAARVIGTGDFHVVRQRELRPSRPL